MEGKVVVVTVVVGFLGIVSAILGFAAEAKRVKASQVDLSNAEFCDYPSTPAPGLGLAAAGLLVLAQVIIHAFAGCLCCKNRTSSSGGYWTAAWIAFIFSWIAFVIGLLMLISAAVQNMRRDHVSGGYFIRYCYVVKPGVSAGGAALALTSVLLGIIYYRSVESLKQAVEPWAPQQGQGIAMMAQPQFPPQPAYPPPPAFVHEDTYNRRQIP
ncbi:unnamed protein product [Spirodela intermedia]|uniref:Uncharacterized protein n=1 Tax=Spirodela intermedia TaxID=51605 RepID=A0A7I8LNW4_SPIIN|nr:unnamed protein product [Spirodela intermedia]